MLKEKIITARNQFMKEHNKDASDALSFAISEIKNAEINTGKRDGLTDAEIISLLQKSVKKMQEAAELFTKGGRPELAEKEIANANLVETFLPKMLNATETEKIVTELLQKFDTPTIKDMGKIMAELKDNTNIDKSILSQILKTKLL
ncbi:MAG: GatB/YqeY domain-containing protein [Rickettsiales bacterium]|jgi:uncharacterized protein YqeY|nr:GatB/YqeY domain-containing protein [Rickettsiales bacterium]